MASNFACESVQRSAGTAPKYLYAPAPEGTSEIIGGLLPVTGVTIPNNVQTSISANFPLGANGVYIIDCVCPLTPAFSITATGSCIETAPGTFVFSGFNNVNIAAIVGSPVTAIGLVELSSIPPTGLTLFQNSGAALVYNFIITKVATLVRS